MQLSLGPIDIRFFSGQNWSTFELGLVTARKAGQAQRETTLRTSFKSDHLLELVGEEDPTDQFQAPDGEVFCGRVCAGIDGDAHTLSAEAIYAAHLRKQALREAAKAARAAAAFTSVSNNGSNGHRNDPVAA
jgi:hypothetical protein